MILLRLLPLVLTLSLTSCIYKMDIEQGNAIDEEKVTKLEVGMSKKQVLFLLGQPAIQDIYHENTWHYLRSLKHNNGLNHEFKSMILTFQNETLTSIKGHL